MFMPEFDWSTIGKEQEQEKVNGCAARRINAQTKEIDVDSLCPDKLFSPKYVDDATANGITVPIETQRMPQLRECRHPDPKLSGSFSLLNDVWTTDKCLDKLVEVVDGAECSIAGPGATIDCFSARYA
jgi:hypothetical protein